MQVEVIPNKNRSLVGQIHWNWLFDQFIPSFVKKNYSPKEKWKTKPFRSEDAYFFFKGILDLSELFTDERPSALPSYFSHEKFRSAYLLYFFPLQAAKFLTLFNLHPAASATALRHGRENKSIKILDLGSGPGTASISYLLWLLSLGKELPPIELHWFDTNRKILKDGEEIIKAMCEHFPKLRERVSVHFNVGEWWKARPDNYSLVIFGNVLNEQPVRFEEQSRAIRKLCTSTGGAGTLLVEPATKIASRFINEIREALLNEPVFRNLQFPIWGPCLHSGGCPLRDGKDWCHFSMPSQIPGRWFKFFSKLLGSERSWLKFTYLWLASKDSAPKAVGEDIRRVVSDLIPTSSDKRFFTALLCEPDLVLRVKLPKHLRVFRGDLVEIKR